MYHKEKKEKCRKKIFEKVLNENFSKFDQKKEAYRHKAPNESKTV